MTHPFGRRDGYGEPGARPRRPDAGAYLVIGSVASLAAHVAVAEPTMPGRVIAAWPSSALVHRAI
jgi:hypothetical protein